MNDKDRALLNPLITSEPTSTGGRKFSGRKFAIVRNTTHGKNILRDYFEVKDLLRNRILMGTNPQEVLINFEIFPTKDDYFAGAKSVGMKVGTAYAVTLANNYNTVVHDSEIISVREEKPANRLLEWIGNS